MFVTTQTSTRAIGRRWQMRRGERRRTASTTGTRTGKRPKGNGFNGVPKLCDFSVFDAEQVIERGGPDGKAAFAGDQDEVAFTEHLVNALVLHGDALHCHGLRRSAKSGQPISNLRLVLDVLAAVTVAGQLTHVSIDRDVVHELAHRLPSDATRPSIL